MKIGGTLYNSVNVNYRVEVQICKTQDTCNNLNCVTFDSANDETTINVSMFVAATRAWTYTFLESCADYYLINKTVDPLTQDIHGLTSFAK